MPVKFRLGHPELMFGLHSGEDKWERPGVSTEGLERRSGVKSPKQVLLQPLPSAGGWLLCAFPPPCSWLHRFWIAEFPESPCLCQCKHLGRSYGGQMRSGCLARLMALHCPSKPKTTFKHVALQEGQLAMQKIRLSRLPQGPRPSSTRTRKHEKGGVPSDDFERQHFQTPHFEHLESLRTFGEPRNCSRADRSQQTQRHLAVSNQTLGLEAHTRLGWGCGNPLRGFPGRGSIQLVHPPFFQRHLPLAIKMPPLV